MNKRFSLLSVITTAIICAILSAILTLFLVGFDLPLLSSHYSFIKKMNTIDALVKTNFLFEVDDETLYLNTINSYLSSLNDDYAFYYNPDQFTEKDNDLKGIKIGIGIDVAVHPDTGNITVIYVNKESPSFNAGLKKGDIILAVDNVDVKNKTFDDVLALMHADQGKVINFSVLREGKKSAFTIELKEFIADSIRSSVIDNVGYIKITNFNQNTVTQFKNALNDLQKKKVKGIIFDLRNNPGGVVDETAEMLDMLVPKGDLINVKYKNGKTAVYAKSDKQEIKLPMAVIINEHSASSAEIFAMTLRDYNKGVIVGVKSFGKGIMQTNFKLSDKTAVKFTTGYIVNKNGDSHHKKGISPDLEVALTESQQKYFYFLDSKEDSQLQSAIAAISKNS